MKVYSIIKILNFYNFVQCIGMKLNFLVILLDLIMNGFGNIEKLKKYGIGWCGDEDWIFRNWDDDANFKN